MSPPSAVTPPPLAETTSSPQLPNADSPSLYLAHPTFAEKQTTWKQNGHAWRGPLSVPAYLRREQYLSETSLTCNGGITHWVLVDTSYPPGGERRVLASCETTRKRALVAYWSTEGAEVEEVVSHCIGSVFCPKEFRGKGYARRMMRELSKILRGWQVDGAAKGRERCLFTVLYSDIGKSFYATLGWHPFTSSHISLPPISKDCINMVSVLPPCRELYAASLKDLCAFDERLLFKRLATMSATKRVRVALVPDLKSMEYHHAREEFIAHEVFGYEPSVKGAIVGDTEGQRAWCIWTRVYGSSDATLYILRLVLEGDESIERTSSSHSTNGSHPANGGFSGAKSRQVDAVASLLLASQREASRWGMTDVQIWNPEPITILAAHRALNLTSEAAGTPVIQVVDRERESITSLMWYGESQEPGLQGLQWKDVEWIGNEKYAWC
ncbi:MAG: hypothetical protein M1839_003386 [Geoglossum umbratile]|nr:MAG: hypothetical protein M1839_003386 [Geoglossum umbratile]